MLDHLWAGWRRAYITGGGGESGTDGRSGIAIPDGQTLFEAILHSGLPDADTLILWRGDRCFALLNAFPYTSGHLMVLPQRGIPELTDLDDEEHAELWEGVRLATRAVQTAYDPDGINVGANLGRGAGAGIPDHLHVHVVPRWNGDTNFMTTIADTRVLPEAIGDSWRLLRDAWPES